MWYDDLHLALDKLFCEVDRYAVTINRIVPSIDGIVCELSSGVVYRYYYIEERWKRIEPKKWRG